MHRSTERSRTMERNHLFGCGWIECALGLRAVSILVATLLCPLTSAQGQPSGWRVETVDDSADVGRYSSLAMRLGNHPVISYYDATNSRLKVATKEGSKWNREVVPDVGDVGQFSSIAVSSKGMLGVA